MKATAAVDERECLMPCPTTQSPMSAIHLVSPYLVSFFFDACSLTDDEVTSFSWVPWRSRRNLFWDLLCSCQPLEKGQETVRSIDRESASLAAPATFQRLSFCPGDLCGQFCRFAALSLSLSLGSLLLSRSATKYILEHVPYDPFFRRSFVYSLSPSTSSQFWRSRYLEIPQVCHSLSLSLSLL